MTRGHQILKQKAQKELRRRNKEDAANQADTKDSNSVKSKKSKLKN